MAKCVNTINFYVCECQLGFNGSNCEFYDSCWNAPCEGCQKISTQSQDYLCLCSKYSNHKCTSEIEQPLGIATSLALNGKNGLIGGFDDLSIKISNDFTFKNYSILRGHTDFINSLVMLNSQVLASASLDKTIKFWNVTNLECLSTKFDHKDKVNNLHLIDLQYEQKNESESYLDKILISVSEDGTAKLWNQTKFVKNLLELEDEKIVTSSFWKNGFHMGYGTNKGRIIIQNLNKPIKDLNCSTGTINAIAILENSKIASSSEKNQIIIWDSANFECIASLGGHNDVIWTLTLLQNSYLASGSADRTIKIWNITSLKCVKTLLEHTGTVFVLVNLDDSKLVSASGDRLIKIWNTTKYEVISTLIGHIDTVYALAVLKEKYLISGSADRTIKVWNTATFKLVTTLRGHNDAVRTLIILENEKIVSGSFDKSIKIWNSTSFECMKTQEAHEDSIYKLELSLDGNLISASADTNIKIWNTSSFRTIANLAGHTNTVLALAVLKNGNLISGSLDTMLRVWNLSTHELITSLSGHISSLYALAVLKNGNLASGSSDNTIKIWNETTFECIAILTDHVDSIYALEVLQNGNLVSGSADLTIKIWNSTSFKCIHTLMGHTSAIEVLSVLPNGNLISGSDDFTLKIWNITSLECIDTLIGHYGEVLVLAVLKNGNIISGSTDKSIRIWKLSSHSNFTQIAILSGHLYRVTALTVSNDDSLIFSGSEDYTIKVWSSLTYELKLTIEESYGIYGLKILKNGNLISTAYFAIKIWNTTSFECIATLYGHESYINTFAILNNGNIVSASSDNTIKIWKPVSASFKSISSEVKLTSSGYVTSISFNDGICMCAFSDSSLYSIFIQEKSKFFKYTESVFHILTLNNRFTLKFLNDKSIEIIDKNLGFHIYTNNKNKFNALLPFTNNKFISSSSDANIKIWTLSEELFKKAELISHKKKANRIIELKNSYLVSASDDFTIKIYDKNYTNIQTLFGHINNVYDLIELSENRLASCSKDRSIIIWNLKNVFNPKMITKLTGHLNAVICLTKLEENLFSGSNDHTIRVWNMENNYRNINVLKGHKGAIQSLIVFQQKFLISGSTDGTIIVWNLINNYKIEQKISCENSINVLEKTAKYFISGTSDHYISVYAQTYKFIGDLKGFTSPVFAIEILDNENIATASLEPQIKIWNSISLELIAILAGHTDRTLALTKLLNGNLVSGSADMTIKIWNSTTFECMATLIEHSDWVRSLALLSDGNLISGSDDFTLKIWNVSTFVCIANLSGHEDGINTVSILKNGNIASGSWDSTIKIWNSFTYELVTTLHGHTEGIWQLRILHDGNIVTSSADATVKIWNSNTFKLIGTLPHNDSVFALEVLQNGYIASGSVDFIIKIWNPINLTLVDTLTGYSVFPRVLKAFKNDLLIVGSKTKIFIVSINYSFDLLFKIKAHKDFVTDLKLLANGNLFSSSYDKTIKIWKMSDSTIELVSKNYVGSTVISMNILSNGDLVSCLSNKSIIIWNTNFIKTSD